jgi:hypothetical protein
MINLRAIKEFSAECVSTLLSIVSWLTLVWAALDMAALLFWPPSPTKSKDPDLSGGFTPNVLVSVAVLLLVSVGARFAAPVGPRRFERRLYWVVLSVAAVLWLATIAQRLLL